MARKPQQYINGEPGKPNDDNLGLAMAGIFPVADDGSVQLEANGYFQLNPSSYDEQKSTNWVQQNTPGNDPILQWVSGGPRTLSFEALVTKDHSGFAIAKKAGFAEKLLDKALDVVGDIASQYAGVNLPPLADLFGGATPGKGNDLSIAAELDYYRSLHYPEYSESGELISSPPLVVVLSGSLLTSAEDITKITDMQSGGSYLPVWVVTNLGIRVTKQLPNLSPMEAIVSFNLMEYIILSPGRSNFKPLPQGTSESAGVFDSVTSLFG